MLPFHCCLGNALVVADVPYLDCAVMSSRDHVQPATLWLHEQCTRPSRVGPVYLSCQLPGVQVEEGHQSVVVRRREHVEGLVRDDAVGLGCQGILLLLSGAKEIEGL
jgi:hypothetical protein